MIGFYDATCDKCRARFGWRGEVRDRPVCPKCGYRGDERKLSEDAEAVDRMFMLLRTHPKDADGETLKEMRKFAGLGMRQAGELLKLDPFSTICRYEDGSLPVPADVADRMAKLYGCGKG